jgi:hypothetical protein
MKRALLVEVEVVGDDQVVLTDFQTALLRYRLRQIG